MRIIPFLLFLSCLIPSVMAQRWERGIIFGSEWHDDMKDMDIDQDGNIYVFGEHKGHVKVSDGSTTGLEVTPMLAGTPGLQRTGNNKYIAKFDSTGQFLWAHSFGENIERGTWKGRITVDTQGNLYTFMPFFDSVVTTSFGKTYQAEKGFLNLLQKFGPDGQLLAEREFFSNEMDRIAIDFDNKNDRLILVCTFRDSLWDNTGLLLKRKLHTTYPYDETLLTFNPNLIIENSKETKTDSDGSRFDTYALEVDDEGNVYMAGAYNGEPSFFQENPISIDWPTDVNAYSFVVKLNEDLNFVAFSPGWEGTHIINDVAVSTSGIVAVCGTKGINDIGYVTRLSSDLEPLWTRTFESEGQGNEGTSVAFDQDDFIYVGGKTWDKVNVAGDTILTKPNYKTTDVLAKFNLQGDLAMAQLGGINAHKVIELVTGPQGRIHQGKTMRGFYWLIEPEGWDMNGPIGGMSVPTYEDSNNGVFDFNTVPVVFQMKSCNVKITAVGQELMADRGDYFQWYLDGEAIYGDTNQVLKSNTPGDYHVKVRFEDGCQTVSHRVNLNDILTGIEQSDTKHSIVYPSQIENHFQVLSPYTVNRIDLRDVLGREVPVSWAENGGQLIVSLQDEVESGILILRIHHSQGTEQVRVLKR